MTSKIRAVAAGVLASIAFTGAQAAVYDTDLSGAGEFSSPGSYSTSFASAAGAATVSIELKGFASLDGLGNCCSDVFHLSVNGTEIFSGSFNMGGGGTNTVLLAPAGSSVLTTTFGAVGDPHNTTEITWAGGVTQIVVPVALLAGSNTLDFSYTGANQGLGDEGWGLGRVTVTAVPEPETYALMLAGIGALGLVARRRRSER